MEFLRQAVEQRQFFGKMTPAEVLAFLARQRQAATAAQQGDRATAYAAFESLYDRRHVRSRAMSRRKTCRSERSAGHAESKSWKWTVADKDARSGRTS